MTLNMVCHDLLNSRNLLLLDTVRKDTATECSSQQFLLRTA